MATRFQERLNFTLSPRPLTPAEAWRLHEELKSTPNILGYTVPELLRLTDVYAAEVGGDFAGACFSVDLRQNWTEIAVVYVLPGFRGMGIGRALFCAGWTRATERQRHVYVLSRNSQVVGWMREMGMTVNESLWRAPLAVQWYMASYMASLHRGRESVRKRKAIAGCPRLVQGMKRFVP